MLPASFQCQQRPLENDITKMGEYVRGTDHVTRQEARELSRAGLVLTTQDYDN